MAQRVLVLLTDEVSSVLVRGQLGHFVASGYEVSIGVHRSSQADPSPFDDGVEVHPIDFVRRPSPLADLRALLQTVRLVRHIRPDVVHASTPKAGLLGMIAARLNHVRVRVYQVRGLRYETASGVARWLYRALERLAMRCATHVLFNSASSMLRAEIDGVIDAGRGIVLGSGNGVDSDYFSPTDGNARATSRRTFELPGDAHVIGFVGRLTKDKGIEDLIEVFETVAANDVWLLLVGPFETGDALTSDLRARIDAHPRIVHRDWADDPRNVYAAIDVLAFPSHREGLPNVPLEAQACGVPVVGYAATGTVDAVIDGETGLLVPVGDRCSLADALRRVLDDRSLREQLGQRGREYVVSSFQPLDVWRRIETVYRSAPET